MKEIKKQLKSLQSSTDAIRSRLQANTRVKNGLLSDKESSDLRSTLKNLDGLFNRICVKHSIKLSRFGRLV